MEDSLCISLFSFLSVYVVKLLARLLQSRKEETHFNVFLITFLFSRVCFFHFFKLHFSSFLLHTRFNLLSQLLNLKNERQKVDKNDWKKKNFCFHSAYLSSDRRLRTVTDWVEASAYKVSSFKLALPSTTTQNFLETDVKQQHHCCNSVNKHLQPMNSPLFASDLSVPLRSSKVAYLRWKHLLLYLSQLIPLT